MVGSERPGREIHKEYREIVVYQIDRHGWRYDASGKGHPVLYPVDRSKPPLPVPTTPTRNPRAVRNFVTDVRRRGGTWPPPERRR